ncbi:S49 family peptidase [Hymenobacter sp. PAMC 26628]|uniref:S49 family peptidase n=1 Tax=Hymenobacter sp. PAMC 26628 TaxID=1484118 RepID=UPI000770619D|nr:S49 family peptidase [Hymenobacter sp. PAMC 26628]AMJ65035.1 hypothetical protein AXW84_06040 [Hymenobacter sp. PAMC 26628]
MRGIWLIEPVAADGYMPLVRQLRAGNFEAAGALFKGKKKANAPYAVAMSLEPGAKAHKASKYSSFDDAPQGSVAVIPVMGPMMSQDFCGSLGTQTLGRLAQEADAHPNIVGHVFVFDTPGGTVSGTENFSNVIKGTQKPAVSFVQGMMCSAGVWAGCGANHIMMGGQTTQIGSIGTMLQINDSRKADKKAGNELIMVRADASYDKNEAFQQLLAGNEQPVKDQLLNPMNAVFLNAVQANRAGKLPTGKEAENVLSGKVYLAADAVKYGLADSIGTFQDAVQLALNLAANPGQGTSNDSPNSNSTMFNLKASWGALLALVGVTATAAPTVSVTEATLEDLNTRAQAQADALVAATGQVSTLTAELGTARDGIKAKETELATATEGLTKANAKVGELETEVKRLGKQPGALGTEVVKTGEDEGTTLLVKDPIVDASAAHNVLAAKYFN